MFFSCENTGHENVMDFFLAFKNNFFFFFKEANLYINPQYFSHYGIYRHGLHILSIKCYSRRENC